MKLSYLALLLLPTGGIATGIRASVNNERSLGFLTAGDDCNAYNSTELCSEKDVTCIVNATKTGFTCLNKDDTETSIKSLEEEAEIRKKHCDKASDYLDSVVDLDEKAIEESDKDDKDGAYFEALMGELSWTFTNATLRKAEVCGKAAVAECYAELADASKDDKTLLWKLDNDEIKYAKEEEDEVEEKLSPEGEYGRVTDCAEAANWLEEAP